jgi:beta-lactamase regulating signal transducer with metallopeptidase domain
MALEFVAEGMSVEQLMHKLNETFPQHTVKKINKTTLAILNGKVQAVVKLKKNKVRVSADLNTRDAIIMILLVLGILLGVIGVLVIFAILYPIYMKKIKAFKQEVYDAISV